MGIRVLGRDRYGVWDTARTANKAMTGETCKWYVLVPLYPDQCWFFHTKREAMTHARKQRTWETPALVMKVAHVFKAP